MENIFNEPILDQMYEFRMEDFEQAVYKKNDEIKKIEGNICDLGDKISELMKKLIPNEEEYQKAFDLLREYELSFGNEISFWSKQYYKLGMSDMNKLKLELKKGVKAFDGSSTFLDYTDAELDEYLQEKIDFNTETYKKYKQKVRMIAEKYPRVLEVHEDSTPIVLNQEEMIQLMELKELDTQVRAEEVKVFFKAGINEILNF